MSGPKFEFDAMILKTPDVDAAYIEFPYDVMEVFGQRGMIKVKVWFDGYLYRGVLASMGNPLHCVGLNKQVRKSIDKQAGEFVHVILEKDEDQAIIEIPVDIAEAFSFEDGLLDFFKSLTSSQKREMIVFIDQVKKQETRERRIIKIFNYLIELRTKKSKRKY